MGDVVRLFDRRGDREQLRITAETTAREIAEHYEDPVVRFRALDVHLELLLRRLWPEHYAKAQEPRASEIAAVEPEDPLEGR